MLSNDSTMDNAAWTPVVFLQEEPLTKRTPIHGAPGLEQSSERTVQQLIHLLDESRASTHLRTSEHFDRALGIWLAALQHAKLATWLDACAGMEKALAPLHKALALLMMEGQENYHDLLGTIYMRLSQGDKRLGQYFTPYGVAKMLAEINFHDFHPPTLGDPPITIHEPACGSGILLLTAAEVIEQRFPGSILQGAVQFSGVDLDPVCVRMAQLNMLLHSIGRIKLDKNEGQESPGAGDLLPDQPVQAFFQPAKIIQGNALAPDIYRLFLDEARFPWIPIMLQRGPAPSTQAGPSAVAPEQQPREGAASLLLETGPEITSEEVAEAEDATLFALAPETVIQTPAPRPLVVQRKRHISPPASVEVSQQELFPSVF